MMALTNLASRSPTVAFHVANIPHIHSQQVGRGRFTYAPRSIRGLGKMLTSTQAACEAIFDLQKERHRAFLVLAQLIDPSVHAGDDDAMDEESNGGVGDPGLVHRGVVCIHNLLSTLQSPSHRDSGDTLKDEVKKAGWVVVFERLLKGELGSFAEMVLETAAEVKKKLEALSS